MEKDTKEIIGKFSLDQVPDENSKEFKQVFTAICDTYDLTNPVDQMIANQATGQLMMVQYLRNELKKIGLYFKSTKDGEIKTIWMNPMAYFLKTCEAEFRNNIRMLKANAPVEKKEQDFGSWLEMGDDGKTKKTRSKKDKK